MCQLKSCLALKDRVYCPDYDSHQDMLDELGIKDDEVNALKTFVRVELTPPEGVASLLEPLDKWTLNVDQDITPEWWDEAAYRPMIEESVEAWRREHVFAEGEHTARKGIYYAYGNATVRASDNATVKAYDSATVRAHGNARVEAYGNARVEAYNSARVEAHGNATVRAYGNATVYAYGNATVEAYDSATVETYGNATVEAYGNATVYALGIARVRAYGNARVEAYGNARVEAHDSATVEAYDSATVEAYGNATVIYPLKKRIVCPAGWTVETHD